MSKLFNFYSDNVDKTWYQSSNVKFSECVDNDNALKTLRVVFSNGSQYEYEKVPVQDYLMFRDSDSQGKALNKYIIGNKYECKRIAEANLDMINEEYVFRSGNGIQMKDVDGGVELFDTKDKSLGTISLGDKTSQKDTIKKALELVGYDVRE